ncbi:hypothetical protein CHARACLAT_027865 [Characodon lateralis]|uniref:Uncharacterized protein n=1 Tax=Characodon lateralis TaxID=208331 RepID=A0ABU7ER49_9TELE|nr:hypothetical protein [Characodon lateralis]
MEIYGGENVELGIRVWQCGGSVEVLPCSRIAHIERAHKPYTENLTTHVRRNALRVAEVWMDNYKSHVYMAWNVPLQYSYSSSSTYAGPGRGAADSAETPRLPSPQTPPPAPPGGAQVPWASSRWDVPGTPPEEGVQKASGIDARATSIGSSRCGGSAALLRAPPGWPSSSPYL